MRWTGLLMLGLVAWVAGCSDNPTTPEVDPGPPRTGFELRVGGGFTSSSEELAFLDAVAAASPRVRTTQVGTSVQGRPIHLVRVANPTPGDDASIADGPVVLVIGSQHGNEPAGREAALKLLRDLAFAETGELVGLLDGVTVLFIPSANPDGRAANSRRNAADIDINRDHLRLASPEARAIAQVLRDFSPDIVVDAHERPGGSSPDMELLWPRNLNVHAPVQDLSRQLVEDQLFPDLNALGHSVGLYGPGAGPPGDENETILRNAVGLRHSLGLLTESAGSQPALDRVATQLDVMRSVLRFRRAEASEIAGARMEAPLIRAAEGRDQSTPFHLFGADNDPSEANELLDPPPCGYRLSSADVTTLSTVSELWSLQIDGAPGGESILSMDQPFMTVIPLLVDGRARAPLVSGVPLVTEMECAGV